MANGSVPEGLPPGTHDIRAALVPGTSQRWGIVNFPQEQSDALRALLQPDELPLAEQRPDAPARIEWWPIMLRGEIDGKRLEKTGLRAYRARTGDLVFAVNWKQGRAYYWAASSH